MLPQQRYLNNLRLAATPRNDPYWANVVLLCDFNGTDGSTTLTDLSNSGHALTANGDAQLDTAQKKFGTASLLLDGAGDYVTALDSDDWYMPGDLTIEAHVRFTALPGTGGQTLCGQWNNGTEGWNIHFVESGGSHLLRYNVRAANVDNLHSATVSISIDTWYHVETSVSSGTVYFFLDGTLITSTALLETPANYALPLAVGATTVPSAYFSGHIDNLRITKGVARHTASFTPPAKEYPSQ